MTFDEAIEALKVDDRVSRAGWRNGDAAIIPGTQGLTVESGRPLAFAPTVGARFNYLPHLDMVTPAGDVLSWVAAHGDVLAEDCFAVETEHANDPGAL
jgi:Protein of unknown function (DUF2829)